METLAQKIVKRAAVDQELKNAEHVISQTAMSKLRRTFRQPRAFALFEFYIELRRLFHGAPPTEDLGKKFDAVVRGYNMTKVKSVGQSVMTLPDPMVINQLMDCRVLMRPWLTRLYNTYLTIQQEPEESRTSLLTIQWKRILDTFAQILPAAAKDRGIYLKGAIRVVHGIRWYHFRTMNPKEEKLEDLKDNMPDVYAALLERGQARKEANAQITKQIQAAGLVPKTIKLLDRVVQLGVDPVTDEATVYALDGTVKPIDQYIDERKLYLRTQQQLQRPQKLETPEDLRKADDHQLKLVENKAIRYVSLTDDKAKVGRLTRIYPVAKVEGEDVVAAGRYKGIFLTDLVNNRGRLLEGSSFVFNPKTGHGGFGLPMRIDPENREPYITVVTSVNPTTHEEEKKLTLKIGNANSFAEVRNIMVKLAALVPSIEMQRVPGSRARNFVFEFKDFGVIRDRMPGLTLSEAAMKELRRYFQDLARAELATSREKLKSFEATAIGGFKPEVSLRVKQKQALAWLAASDNKGVCALDTGIGKGCVAIGAAQKMLRDGFADEGSGTNGRFLFVCPVALRGNLPKEIHTFMTPDAAKNLLERLDVMSYPQFQKSSASHQWQGREWNPEEYIAIFFDEAQELKNISSRTAKAALALKHPRKICLTASPMEKKPLEAYVLAAVSSSIDLMHPTEGASARSDMRKFKDQFCEELGGRIVGVKQDPATRKALDTWVKQNVFFADKRDVEEVAMPQLHQETSTVTMTPEVERAYRETAQGIATAMRGMVSKFRDLGYIETVDEAGQVIKKINPEARDPQVEKTFGLQFRSLFKQLAVLANYPEQAIPGAGYPKLDAASQIVSQKLEREDGARTLLFSDDKMLVELSAQRMSEDLPGYHACCLNNKIDIYRNGSKLSEYKGLRLPFSAKEYVPDPSIGVDIPRKFKANEWQQFVLSVVVSPSAEFRTCSLLGQTYQQGQNLQAFNTVVHLDRDSWNSEDMKQRSARAWRQGQQNPVDEFTIDAVYASPTDDFDRTVDEIMSYAQAMEGRLFDTVIKEAQKYQLGQEWFEMEFGNASQMAVSKRNMEMTLSPYVSKNAVP